MTTQAAPAAELCPQCDRKLVSKVFTHQNNLRALFCLPPRGCGYGRLPEHQPSPSGKEPKMVAEAKEPKVKRQRLVTGGDPDVRYGPIPSDDRFQEEATDYIPDERLREIGDALIDKKLRALGDASIGYLWQRKGSKSKGRVKLGTCQKPGGLLAFYSSFDFIVLLGADACRDRQLTNWQIEALLFHELSHAHQDENGKWGVVGHDSEIFHEEVREYGLWRADLRAAAKAFQPRLLEAHEADAVDAVKGMVGLGLQSVSVDGPGIHERTDFKSRLGTALRDIPGVTVEENAAIAVGEGVE